MVTIENGKKLYTNFDESRKIYTGTVGAIRAIGIMGNAGNTGTMGTLRTMENEKKLLQEL